MEPIPFYDRLFTILTQSKYNYHFKLSVSIMGHPYISWSSITRTLLRQPTLINLLKYGYNPPTQFSVHDMSVFIGKYMCNKLSSISMEKREEIRETLAHNLATLYHSYNQDRHDEKHCIRVIASRVMTNCEYELITATHENSKN